MLISKVIQNISNQKVFHAGGMALLNGFIKANVIRFEIFFDRIVKRGQELWSAHLFSASCFRRSSKRLSSKSFTSSNSNNSAVSLKEEPRESSPHENKKKTNGNDHSSRDIFQTWGVRTREEEEKLLSALFFLSHLITFDISSLEGEWISFFKESPNARAQEKNEEEEREKERRQKEEKKERKEIERDGDGGGAKRGLRVTPLPPAPSLHSRKGTLLYTVVTTRDFFSIGSHESLWKSYYLGMERVKEVLDELASIYLGLSRPVIPGQLQSKEWKDIGSVIVASSVMLLKALTDKNMRKAITHLKNQQQSQKNGSNYNRRDVGDIDVSGVEEDVDEAHFFTLKLVQRDFEVLFQPAWYFMAAPQDR